MYIRVISLSIWAAMIWLYGGGNVAFKVVLVDDDLLVLQDLETLADWGKYGFTIAQTFTNGVAALRGIREIRPDFIVTDIRMPIMDGLQFVEKVRTLLPETRILLLTAYSDFDYAKKAIDLGVFNYLLKNELNKETLEEHSNTFTLGTKSVNRLGYGAMQLAGPGVFGPPRDRHVAITVLREALALGVNHIDTSDLYGPHVTNQIIREALYPYSDDLTIVTKNWCTTW